MLKTYKIQDICVLEKGKQIDTSLLDDNNPYQYINGGISASGYYDKYNTKENTIIVSEGGASCGYVNFMTEKFWCGCHCYRLMEPKVKSEYLYYALKANQQGIMRLRSGCTMPNIKKSSFYNMQIKLDNNQDNQIKVTSILKKVTTLILKRKEQLTKLDFLAKSRFLEMFGDVIRNDKNWKVKKWKDVLEIKNGKSQKDVIDEKGKYPIYGSGGIIGYASNYITKANSIVIGRKGSINKPFIVKENFWNVDTAFGIEPDNRNINLHYLFLFCNFFDFKRLNKAAVLPSLVKSDLLNIQMPIPPFSIQEDFSIFIEQLDKSKFRIKKSLEKLEMTYKALLQEYFG